MPQLKMTERAINKLAAPDPSGKQTLYWDSDVKGFAVLCSGVTNAKTYIVQRTLPDGRNRRVTVGAVNELSLEKATSLAQDMLHDLRHGRDPKKKLANPTLQTALGLAKTGFPLRRRLAIERLPEFEELREQGKAIKDHTIAHLDFYLELYEQNVTAAGFTAFQGTVPAAAAAGELGRSAFGSGPNPTKRTPPHVDESNSRCLPHSDPVFHR